jgi:anti-sigma regulatory factor (Ser/Thr protein kinase)
MALPPEFTSPKAARAFLLEVLGRWSVRVDTDAATLVVSELVTNAVLHARSPMVLRLGAVDSSLLISVEDLAPLFSPEDSPGRPGGGRGLAIVAAVSQQWGVEPTAEGKRVWCRLPLTPGATADYDRVNP